MYLASFYHSKYNTMHYNNHISYIFSLYILLRKCCNATFKKRSLQTIIIILHTLLNAIIKTL